MLLTEKILKVLKIKPNRGRIQRDVMQMIWERNGKIAAFTKGTEFHKAVIDLIEDGVLENLGESDYSLHVKYSQWAVDTMCWLTNKRRANAA